MLQLNYTYEVKDNKKHYNLQFLKHNKHHFTCTCVSKHDYAVSLSLSVHNIKQYKLFMEDAMFRELHKAEILNAIRNVSPASDTALSDFSTMVQNTYESFIGFKQVALKLYKLDYRTFNLMVYLMFTMHYNTEQHTTVMQMVKHICKQHNIKYTKDYLLYLLTIILSAAYSNNIVMAPQELIESQNEDDIHSLYNIVKELESNTTHVNIEDVMKFYYYI